MASRSNASRVPWINDSQRGLPVAPTAEKPLVQNCNNGDDLHTEEFWTVNVCRKGRNLKIRESKIGTTPTVGWKKPTVNQWNWAMTSDESILICNCNSPQRSQAIGDASARRCGQTTMCAGEFETEDKGVGNWNDTYGWSKHTVNQWRWVMTSNVLILTARAQWLAGYIQGSMQSQEYPSFKTSRR